MMKPIWNKIDYKDWTDPVVDIWIHVNHFGEGPIILTTDRGDESVDVWLTPEETRRLAEQLIKAADATEKAGKINAES